MNNSFLEIKLGGNRFEKVNQPETKKDEEKLMPGINIIRLKKKSVTKTKQKETSSRTAPQTARLRLSVPEKTECLGPYFKVYSCKHFIPVCISAPYSEYTNTI